MVTSLAPGDRGGILGNLPPPNQRRNTPKCLSLMLMARRLWLKGPEGYRRELPRPAQRLRLRFRFRFHFRLPQNSHIHPFIEYLRGSGRSIVRFAVPFDPRPSLRPVARRHLSRSSARRPSPVANRSVPITRCPISRCQSSVATRPSPVARCHSSVAGCQSHVANR